MNIIELVKIKLLKKSECEVFGHDMKNIVHEINDKDSLLQKKINKCCRCDIKNVHIYNVYTGTCYEDSWGYDLKCDKIKLNEFNDLSNMDRKRFQEG